MQTTGHADRALFPGEFRLLQLARLKNSFMTYYPIDFKTDMAKVPYSVTTNQSSTPIQKPS